MEKRTLCRRVRDALYVVGSVIGAGFVQMRHPTPSEHFRGRRP